LLAIRIGIAVVIITLAVWKLAPQLFAERVSEYDFLRGLVLSLITGYSLIELFMGYRHFRRLKQLRQTG